MNILLTGSGGFIGKNIKNSINNKYNLLTPRSYELNLCDKTAVNNYFSDNKIDFIIHCASTGGAKGIDDPVDTIETNVSMVNNLLKYKNDSTKVMLFGSGAMYNKSRNLHKVKESEIGKYIPKDLYGQSKVKISEITRSRDDVLCLNIFGCYGYGEKESRFPSYAVNQNLNHQTIFINQNVVFDYLFVEDMVKIVEYFIENQWQDSVINITPQISVSLLEIAQTVNEISDFKSEIIVKNPVMNYEYTGDNSLLMKNIPSFSFTDIKDGIKKLYDYNRNFVAIMS
ncbi:NAD-dependent epimerase/dehydratase family protein [bacterium]|nr:NAD-dependent epimerase/dehydratase family protein [bacterium]